MKEKEKGAREITLLAWRKRMENALNVDLSTSCRTKYTHRTAWRGAADMDCRW